MKTRPLMLSATFVRNVNAPGRYGDGRGGLGLGLLVRPATRGGLNKCWTQSVRIDGIPTSLGLGRYPVVTLGMAREKALDNAREIALGHDPRRSAGDKTVDAVTTADVMAVLSPIWSTKRVTAKRVRQRIGAVMKWAIAQGLRIDNPAGDAISAALPKHTAVQKHQRALPHAEVAAALRRVRRCEAYRGIPLAFEFLVLTAARSGEVREGRWDEIDRDGAVWAIPAERMKNGREHRVPLADRALEVLDDARELADAGRWLFPSPTGRALHQSTLSGLMRDLGIDAVPHGFRSSFRDWAAECTDPPREVCELALAHVNTDRVEAAYRRTDLFDRRRVVRVSHVAYANGLTLVRSRHRAPADRPATLVNFVPPDANRTSHTHCYVK